MNNQQGVIPFISGIFVGSLAGAAMAILYAPQSGDETRQRIRETATQTADSARLAVINAQEQAIQAIEEAQSRATRFVSQLGDGRRQPQLNASDQTSQKAAKDVASSGNPARQSKKTLSPS